MRVYLASTLPALAAALQAGQIGPAPLAGFAVTPALREWYASGDLDELEYAAMAVAARASLRLLAADSAAPPRRVTLAADVPDEQVSNVRRSRRARRGPRRRPSCRWPGWRPRTWTTRRPTADVRAAAAAIPPPIAVTTTRSSPSRARRATSCSGTPCRSCPICSADRDQAL